MSVFFFFFSGVIILYNNWLITSIYKRIQVVLNYLKRPKEAWNNPAKKVAVNASLRWRTGSLIKETIWLSIIPMTKDAEEVGPTARCLELPSTEYSKGGTKLESEICHII